MPSVDYAPIEVKATPVWTIDKIEPHISSHAHSLIELSGASQLHGSFHNTPLPSQGLV